MVKVTFLALASVLAASVSAGSSSSSSSAALRRKKTIKLGNRKLQRGDPATEALLRKARPYKKSNAVANKNTSSSPHRRRKLDDEDFEIDGSYSLKFSQCVDIKTKDEDLFDDELVEYVQAGQVVSASSYVLFHVCQGDNCYYEADDDLYVVDLPTYLTNVATYHANKRNDYCEVCEEYEDYCEEQAAANGDDAVAGDDAAADEDADEDADDEDGDDEDGDGDEDGDEEDGDEEEEEGEEDEQQDEENQDEDNNEEGEEDEQDGEEDNEGEEGEEDNNQEEGENEDGEGEDRRLKKIDRKAITRKLAQQYVDCDQCNNYECFVDEDDMDDGQQRRDELDEEVSEWIADLAECKESGVQWNDMDLYIGAMCSPYGDGVELAVFVNEDCTMYTNQMSFYNVFDPYNDNDDGINYLTYAEEFIKSAFSEVTPCLQQEYADPEEDNDDADDDEEEEYEVNDYCKEVFEGDAISFNNCAADENEDEEDNDDEYNWYAYDMEEADDIEEVCVTLNQMAGEYSHVYDEDLSGTWYERNADGSIHGEDEGSGMIALSPEIIAVIVGVCLIVVAGAAFLLKPKKKPTDNNEPVYQGGTML
eukprot:CAMPEP_0196138966 /NCGR_PEP_ID=MMETSP0910-20130528/6411_1 /TAXON_ID=49265 /ORGANISM="Thalassiosira rotula, Strain GSO102" /LENGTH=590 /DNA_ID=CAMNT_0041399637 /DNA_START=10 /DNA_END=1782 /DNA_ORIENTATION=-